MTVTIPYTAANRGCIVCNAPIGLWKEACDPCSRGEPFVPERAVEPAFDYVDSATWSQDQLDEERRIAAAELGIDDDPDAGTTAEFFLAWFGADNGFAKRALELENAA